MKCPHCSAENENNAIFCSGCDAWILGEKFEEPTPPPTAEPPAPSKTAKPEHKPRRLWLKIGLPVAAVALIAATLVLLFWPREKPAESSKAVRYLQHIMPYHTDTGLQVICDAQVLESPFSASGYTSYQRSLNGKSAAILLSSSSLYLVREKHIQYLDSMVTDYALSTGGNGILFVAAGKLGYYHSSLNAPNLIPMGSGMEVADMAISPDGMTYAYILRDCTDGTHYLMCYLWDAADSINLGAITSSTKLLSVSNGGEYIYAADSVNVHCYSAYGGAEVLGIYSSGFHSRASSFTLNEDQTQLLCYYGGKTYLSDKGQKAEVICEATIRPIKPELCIELYRSDVCFSPYYNLLDSYYVEFDQNFDPILSSSPIVTKYMLWYVDSGGVSRPIADGVSRYLLDHSCSQLYYIDYKYTLYRYDVNDRQIDPIGEYAYTMALSPDGEKLYYSNSDGIFCHDTAALSLVTTLSANRPYRLCIGEDSRLYYTSDGLFTIDDQGTPQQLIGNCSLYSVTNNGFLYVTGNDGFYVCGADGTAKLLFALTNEPVERPYPNVTYG